MSTNTIDNFEWVRRERRVADLVKRYRDSRREIKRGDVVKTALEGSAAIKVGTVRAALQYAEELLGPLDEYLKSDDIPTRELQRIQLAGRSRPRLDFKKTRGGRETFKRRLHRHHEAMFRILDNLLQALPRADTPKIQTYLDWEPTPREYLEDHLTTMTTYKRIPTGSDDFVLVRPGVPWSIPSGSGAQPSQPSSFVLGVREPHLSSRQDREKARTVELTVVAPSHSASESTGGSGSKLEHFKDGQTVNKSRVSSHAERSSNPDGYADSTECFWSPVPPSMKDAFSRALDLGSQEPEGFDNGRLRDVDSQGDPRSEVELGQIKRV